MLTFIWFIILYKYERRRTSNATLISQESWKYFINLASLVVCSDVITAIYQSVQMY